MAQALSYDEIKMLRQLKLADFTGDLEKDLLDKTATAETVLLKRAPIKEAAAQLFDRIAGKDKNKIEFDDFIQFCLNNQEWAQKLEISNLKRENKADGVITSFTCPNNSTASNIDIILRNNPAGLSKEDFSNKLADMRFELARQFSPEHKKGDIVLGEINVDSVNARILLGRIFQKKLPDGTRADIPGGFFKGHDENHDSHFDMGELRKMIEELDSHPKDFIIKPNELPKPPAAKTASV